MDYTQQDVIDNLGLVHMVAHRMYHLTNNGIVEYDDLVSEGTLGLIHALSRFDPKKGFKFSSYGVMCIRGYMLGGNRRLFKEIWKAKDSRYEVPCFTISMYAKDEAFGTHPKRAEYGNMDLVPGMDDRGQGQKDIFENTHADRIWERLFTVLSPRQREVIYLLRQGVSQRGSASTLGISRQAVHQAYRIAIEKAKRHFLVPEEAA